MFRSMEVGLDSVEAFREENIGQWVQTKKRIIYWLVGKISQVWSFLQRATEDQITGYGVNRLQGKALCVAFSSCISLNAIQLGKHSSKPTCPYKWLVQPTHGWCCISVVFWSVGMLCASVQYRTGLQLRILKDTVISRVTGFLCKSSPELLLLSINECCKNWVVEN